MEKTILALHDIEAVKFGNFVLKSGINSPIYFDLRRIVSFPSLMIKIADLMWDQINQLSFDLVCGVPYTALPIATAISLKHDIPMVMRRKEAKDYGTRQMVEGVFEPEQNCLVVEDLVTSGGSVLETVEQVEAADLEVTDIVCFIDREQGGKRKLDHSGYNLHACITITEILETLLEHEKIDNRTLKQVEEFLYANQF